MGYVIKKRKMSLAYILNVLLEEKYKNATYKEQAERIYELVDKGKLEPVKKSNRNGKTPALYEKYWYLEKVDDHSEYIEEISLLNGYISTRYYMNHLDEYHKDREYVLRLNEFMNNLGDHIKTEISENERSFQIWQKEKMFEKGNGFTILARCGINPDMLNMYKTTEPLAYYKTGTSFPGNIIIVENEDPYYGLRRYLGDGNKTVFGIPVSAVIYGAGHRFTSMVKDINISLESRMTSPENEYLYFGDLDYVGISIFENSRKNADIEIKPFKEAYIAMLDKKERLYDDSDMPDTKSGQQDRMKGTFLSYFSEKDQKRICEFLEKRKYIPQEILNTEDY